MSWLVAGAVGFAVLMSGFVRGCIIDAVGFIGAVAELAWLVNTPAR